MFVAQEQVNWATVKADRQVPHPERQPRSCCGRVHAHQIWRRIGLRYPQRDWTQRAGKPMGSAVPADWRRSKARRTATEPSPMAAATRLTEPLRTSPTANMPGLLVSRNNGVRFRF
jgi:hypothetical protein